MENPMMEIVSTFVGEFPAYIDQLTMFNKNEDYYTI